MSDFQLSGELVESTSQGNSSMRISAVTAETVSQTSLESPALFSNVMAETVSQASGESVLQFSSIMAEVIVTVPRIRANQLLTMN